jgi:hypothetical protein
MEREMLEALGAMEKSLAQMTSSLSSILNMASSGPSYSEIAVVQPARNPKSQQGHVNDLVRAKIED